MTTAPAWWRQVHPGHVVARASTMGTAWLQRRWQRPAGDRGVQLPFSLETPLRGYVHHAYPLGILSSHGIGLEELSPYFIQLLFPHDKLTRSGRQRIHFTFFPTVSAVHLAALGFFTASEWTMAAIDRPRAAVIADVIEALHAGRYVMVRANECFMPASRCFLVRDHRHSFLILGYDPQRDVFLGPAYAQDGTFALQTVPAAWLADAIQSRRGGVPDSYSEQRQVMELSPERTGARTPDPAETLARLRDYARGVDNSRKYLGGEFMTAELRALGTRKSRDGVYGIGIYDHFRRYLADVIEDTDSIDLRATRVLMDHKRVIAASLLRVERARLIDPSVRAAFADVLALATQLHHSAFAWNASRTRDAGRVVYDLLHDVQTAELEALGVLYAPSGPASQAG